MNNFIFENTTKVYFGKGAVREYLAQAAAPYGGTVLLACGGGSRRSFFRFLRKHNISKTYSMYSFYGGKNKLEKFVILLDKRKKYAYNDYNSIR